MSEALPKIEEGKQATHSVANVLSRRLRNRLTREELLERNILKKTGRNISPNLIAAQKSLELKQKTSSLAQLLLQRPLRKDLVTRGVLKEKNLSPALHAQRAQLESRQKKDRLQSLLANRPARDALIKQSILLDTGVDVAAAAAAQSEAKAVRTFALPTAVAALAGKPVASVCAGFQHTLALTVDGELYAWGNGAHGVLGLGTEADAATPTKVEVEKLVQVAAGDYHNIAIGASGKVYSWGWGWKHRLGHGSEDDVLVPTEIVALTDQGITQVAGGGYFSLALDEHGKVYSWGWGQHGALGHNSSADAPTPTTVEGMAGHKVVSVAAGNNFAVAVTHTDEVFVWGAGNSGQLGVGNTNKAPAPVQAQDIAQLGAVDMSVGGFHVLAVNGDGAVFAWGLGKHGRLGVDGDALTSPTQIEALSAHKIVKVVAGIRSSGAVADDGTLFMWGNNSDGELGSEEHASACAVPAKVGAVSGVAGVALGYGHTVALDASNGVWSWGCADHGALGV